MRYKKGDIIIILIAVLAIVSYFGIKLIHKESDKKDIVIYVDGNLYERISAKDIEEELKIHIDLVKGKFIDINIDKNGVYVENVTCPDRICVKTGRISKIGESIVCLPNRVQIYIEGSGGNDVDNVSY